MLDKDMTQRLINKISYQFKYDVNVMDEKAIIIASTDTSRIGNFHEGAYKIIQENKAIHIARETEDLIGIKPGVSMLIYLKNKIIGVLGISGDPDAVLPIAGLAKLTFETMIEYELYKINKNQRINKNRDFINALFYETPINIKKIRKYAKQEGYQEDLFRLPILVRFDFFADLNYVQREYKNRVGGCEQDIIFPVDSSTLVIYKSIPKSAVKNYKKFGILCKSAISDNILNALFYGQSGEKGLRFYIALPIHSFYDYAKALRYLEWMESYLDVCGSNSCEFFIDYIFEYLFEQANFQNLDPVIDFYNSLINQCHMGADSFYELVDTFINCDMDLDECANRLFLHKNTVKNRLNKVKEIIEMDNFKNIRGCILLLFLSYTHRNGDKAKIND